MIAAARLDVGHVLPNNFLTNSSVVDLMTHPLPVNFDLNSLLHNATIPGWTYPVPTHDTSFINASFSCQFKYPKGWAETLLAVLVATASMFGTGWAVAVSIATFFVMKYPAGELHSLEGTRDWC